MRRRWFFVAYRQMTMIIISIIALIPVYFVLVTSIKSHDDYVFNKWGLPETATLDRFRELVQGENLLIWLGNSALVSTTAVLLTVGVASLAAFSFARLRPPGRRWLFVVLTALIVLPPVVLLLPLFRTMVSLGLINRSLAVIITYVGIMIPVSTYLLTSFYRSLPDELMDAAAIDGCSAFQMYWRIALPLSGPAVVTAALVVWLYAWNEILISVVFLQQDSRTLMAGLALFKGKYTTNIPLTMAGVAIAMIPSIGIYLIGQRWFMKGLTEGSVK